MNSLVLIGLPVLAAAYVLGGWMAVFTIAALAAGVVLVGFVLLVRRDPKEAEAERQEDERKQREQQRLAKLQGWEADAQRAPKRVASARPEPEQTDTPNFMMALDAQAQAGLQRCRERGDWESIRLTLQKVAYGLTQASEEDKRSFAAFAASYVKDDPLYHTVLATVLPAVRAQPGMKQTQTYALLPSMEQEWVRYALYYADELGQLQRVKKGNTYTLWEPGSAPVATPKPQPRRKPKEST